MNKMKENSSLEEEAATKSGTFTSARVAPGAPPYDPRASAEPPSASQASIPLRKFFKSERGRAPRQPQTRASYNCWTDGKTRRKTQNKTQNKTKAKKESSKKAKVTKVIMPVSDEDEDGPPPLMKPTKPVKPKLSAPPVPVFNGNLSSPPFPSKKFAPSPSTSNGNISAEAATGSRKKPSAGKSPDHSPPPLQLIDLSDSDELEPRTGFVSPHQVGFQVN